MVFAAIIVPEEREEGLLHFYAGRFGIITFLALYEMKGVKYSLGLTGTKISTSVTLLRSEVYLSNPVLSLTEESENIRFEQDLLPQ